MHFKGPRGAVKRVKVKGSWVVEIDEDGGRGVKRKLNENLNIEDCAGIYGKAQIVNPEYFFLVCVIRVNRKREESI